MRDLMSSTKLKKDILKELEAEPLSLAEIALKLELKEKKVFRLLRSLFEKGEIAPNRGADGSRKYRLTTEEEKASQASAEEEIDEDEDEEDEEM
jgi:DNA-binding IclR family transcriptional regulator